MSYPARNIRPTPVTFGMKGQMIDLSGADATLPKSSKGIMVCGAGNVVYLPAGNADGEYVTITSAPVGFIPGHVVKLVRSTANGTTATVCTIEDS